MKGSFKRAISAVAISMSLVSPAFSQTKTPSMQETSPERMSQDESLLTVLQKTIVDAAYDRVDLEKVIQDLRERYKLNIHVSWTALEAEGVRRDQRIEVRLNQVSLATLLDIILREAGATGSSGKVTYHVANGVLIISTGEQAREETVLRAYNVADLLESGYAIRRFANTPVLGLALTGREFVGGEERKETGGGGGIGGSGGGGGGGSLFSGGGQDPSRPSEMERIESLINLVLENIEPDTWTTNGGEQGSVNTFGSTLLINHTLRVHRRIAEFFAMLRGVRPQPVDVDAAIVRVRSDKAMEWRRDIGPGFPRLTTEHADHLAMTPNAEGVLFRGSTSGFNGQGVWFSALTQRDVVSGFLPVVGQQVSALAPQSESSTAGLELIVLPLITPDSDQLTVDVQMAWVPSTQLQQKKVALAGAAVDNSLDQTIRSMRSVSSTTSVKLGDAIALSIPNQLSDQGTALEWEDWLIVRVHKPGE